MTIFLEEEEIRQLTGRKARSAQATTLKSMGIAHKVRADGSLVVLRSHIEKTLDGLPEKSRVKEWQPDWSSLNAPPAQPRK